MTLAHDAQPLRQLLTVVSPLLQATAAATVAWIIALRVGAHDDPFFAPISAVVALSAPTGERGLQAARILFGVMLGIAVGEVTVAVLGAGYGRLAVSCFTAMAIARAAGAQRVVIIQAAVGAILTVIAAEGEAGVYRLMDASIGGGVALLFSQILFAPEPIAMLRRAEKQTLRHVAAGLEMSAEAAESGDRAAGARAVAFLRKVRQPLSELTRLRAASRNVARRTVAWRWRLDVVARERESADHLEMFGSAAVTLARTVANDPAASRPIVEPLRALASVVDELARDPGDAPARQRAVSRSLEIARALSDQAAPVAAVETTARNILRMMVKDIIVFAGVEADEAAQLLRDVTGKPA